MSMLKIYRYRNGHIRSLEHPIRHIWKHTRFIFNRIYPYLIEKTFPECFENVNAPERT